MRDFLVQIKHRIAGIFKARLVSYIYIYCFNLFVLALLGEDIRIDLLNPSGEACNTFSTCSDQLVSSEGARLKADPSWHPAITFNVLSGDYCIHLTQDLVFEGLDCIVETRRPLCKYDCYQGQDFFYTP